MQTKETRVTGYAHQILGQVRSVVVGKDPVLLWVLAAILAKGHILLEDIPGVGKTTMALAFSKTLGLTCARICCAQPVTTFSFVCIYTPPIVRFLFSIISHSIFPVNIILIKI